MLKRTLLSLLLLATLTTLSACEGGMGGDANKVSLSEASFSDMPGWEVDDHAKGFALFQHTCGVNARRGNSFVTKTGVRYADAAAWNHVCSEAQRLTSPTDEEARAFFHFSDLRRVGDFRRKA